MQVDDPPYISVGTAVSAKYKGAFCEAKVSKVVRVVKCKVNYKMGGTSTVTDEQIKGTLRVGHTVQAKHPEKKDFVEAVIGKIQDCSQYTVVFDDGDITTLRRTALCMKSGRHFNESETLDQLPLTNPEHFGNPVMGGRRGRRYKQEDSSEGEGEEENEPDLEGYSTDVGRVISVEATDKKRNKDNWFPALVVIPSAQPTVRINVKDEYLVRSFKDGRYYTVPKKEISDFSRELAGKVESSVLAEAVSKAVAFLDNNELPVHWERNSLFNMQSMDSDSEENLSEVSDGQPNEEKDRFVAQLYNFMDDSGTPLNKSPVINKQDVDLHRMFRAVHKMGGYNRVTNQNKWRSVTTRLRLPNTQITYNQVKGVYRKYLLSYEGFYKNLGVTMLNHNRAPKKNRGRSLIRDKDRVTPVNSPKPEKDEDSGDKKEIEKPSGEDKAKTKIEPKVEEKLVKRKEIMENSDTSSSDAAEQSEPLPSTSRDLGRPRRVYNLKEKKLKPVEIKPKPVEVVKKDEDEKQIQIQQTRSKSQVPKEAPKAFVEKKKEVKPPEKTPSKIPKKIEDDKKRGKKKSGPDEKASVEIIDPTPSQSVNVGDKLKVYYGPTHESKVTYEAKVLEIDKDPSGPVYLVHYTGWNNRYDEWIPLNRIAENLSAATKAKRLKQNASATTSSKSSPNKTAGKRGRGMSITGRSTETPRSTTPSSVTSSSSRTKSPATPATRSTSRITRQDQGRRTRRASAQTDASVISDSDSDSGSESELSRTRSGTKTDEIETKLRKPSRIPTKIDKTKDDNETEKEETRRKKAKRSPDKSEDSEDETGTNPPKGRDFDLNQIRSELKGFAKAIKVPSLDTGDKEGLSSSDDSNLTPKIEEVVDEKKEKSVEKSPSSDDIYEFKEPEPFEYETRPKLGEDKGAKKRLVPRLFEDVEKKGKISKSPVKDKESPEGERKRFRRTPVKKIDESDDDDDDDKRDEDPFDKLVESPSFNVVRSAKLAEVKQKPVSNILEAPLSLFRDLAETVDGFSRDNMDLSDTESQTPIFSREHELFSDTFGKASPDQNVLDLEFSSKSDDLKKGEFCRKIVSSSDESNEETDDDLMVTHSSSSYQGKKREPEASCSKIETPVSEVKEEIKSPAPQISPALQETDSSLLEAICASQPISIAAKLEEAKDLNLKTGTKIADSILQKFNSIKNSADKSPKRESDSEQDLKSVPAKVDLKLEEEPIESPKIELKAKPSEVEAKMPLIPPKSETPDVKKKRKPLSRAFIEESDSDSSDSEQLIIARSDEDSQTNSLDKPDLKESDSNLSVPPVVSTDDSQSQEEQRNFKFDTVEKSPAKEPPPEPENAKEDDSQLHSLLLCEETFPTSPAPATSTEGPAVSEQRTKTKSVLEMPFASAPGTSNNKNMLLNIEHKEPNKPKPPPLVFAAETREHASAVLDNTPPTTPESTISNLSPRGDPEEWSPNTVENESGKSNEAEPDFGRKRRNSSLNKSSMFSEDDSQTTNEATGAKKARDDVTPASCKKRRKSARASEETPPVKRGRKPLNRSRHNSDSDDTSEHSMISSGANVALSFERRSPRPSKYNFFVEFDPNMNSEQRISVLQQKLSQLRKTYAEVKTELATVERRRKKIRRREREAMKVSKQELVCA